MILKGYIDAYFVGDRDSKKSTLPYFFTLEGNCTSLKLQLQPLVALSITEAKYIIMTNAFKEAMWLIVLLSEIKLLQGQVVIYLNNQSTIHLCRNPVYHEKTKHVDIKYHFVKDQATKENIKIEKVSTKDNPANIGTKMVTASKFKHA